MSDAAATAEPPSAGAPPGARAERLRRYAVAGAFLAPAAVLLGVWIVYPTISTTKRSLFDRAGDTFVWFDNYKEIFTTDLLVTAIKNNAIWIGVVPALVTAIGLVFAVLTERVAWSVAFKTAVFMPMAISLLAAGVIWRLMYIQDPSQGTINAAVRGAKELVVAPGPLSSALPSTEGSRWQPATRPRPGDTTPSWASGKRSASPRSPSASSPRTPGRQSNRSRSRTGSQVSSGAISSPAAGYPERSSSRRSGSPA